MEGEVFTSVFTLRQDFCPKYLHDPVQEIPCFLQVHHFVRQSEKVICVIRNHNIYVRISSLHPQDVKIVKSVGTGGRVCKTGNTSEFSRFQPYS